MLAVLADHSFASCCNTVVKCCYNVADANAVGSCNHGEVDGATVCLSSWHGVEF